MATKKISELTAISTVSDTDVLPIVDSSELETKKITGSQLKTYVQGDLNTRLTTAEAVIGNETDTYSASSTYALGSLVIYNSLLYKCTTAITVAEAWNASKWTQMSLTSLIQSNSNYSTTEQRIGTWIDGKPLYRKILNGTKQSGATLEFDISTLNIGFFAYEWGILYSPSNDFNIAIPYYENSTTYVIVSCRPTTTKKISVSSSTSTYTNGNTILSIIYTKTTD